jgi:anti-sigma regulatory factor (Ser/Thr protein kinase)
MRELSLHIMDIIQNSITADASFIEITIEENIIQDYLKIVIKDNGRGIDREMLTIIKDPFITTRTSRKVGLGISLFEAACNRCEGALNIESNVGIGTTLTALMKYSHIDRAPIGKLQDTIMSLLLYPNLDFIYRHLFNENEFILDTREIRKIAGNDLGNQETIFWIRDYILEGINAIGANIT